MNGIGGSPATAWKDRLTPSTTLLVLAVIAAACVPYLPTIDDYFVQDDFGVVQLLVKRPWTTFPRWFTMPWMEDIWAYTPDEIRPFVAFTYQLTGKFTPGRPELHHVLNIAIHAANAVLVLMLGRLALGLSPVAAAFGAVVFAVLPVQAESVAWITGRVDSMPAFFYLASFLAYVRWRHDGRRAAYAWALALFFVALFSKQNTITMGASLVAYDLVVLDRERRGSFARCVAAWLPFALLTAGYLLLRQVLFGSAVRGGVSSLDVVGFAAMTGRHLQRVTLGHTAALQYWEIGAALAVAAGIVVMAWRSTARRRLVICFGLLWWIIGVLPSALAGYESPRHVHLASVGWAFTLALLLDSAIEAAQSRHRRGALVALAIATAVIALYVVRLVPVVNTWQTHAAISSSGGRRVIEDARAAPAGSLLLVRLPKPSWEWAAPFSLEPPYAEAGLRDRIRLVTPQTLHCCGGAHWERYTRDQLRTWLDAPGQPPVVALYFADGTGAESRLTEAAYPQLRVLIRAFLDLESAAALDQALADLFERVVRR